MRTLYLIIFSCNSLFTIAQTTFLTFDFAGILGNEATHNSNSSYPSIQNPSIISRGSGLTADANANRFNSVNFNETISIDLEDYLAFTITPTTNYLINISQITIKSQRSGSGPQNFVIRTSIDSYSSNATNIVSITSTTIEINNFIFITPITTSAAINIRIYGYSSLSGTGTWGPGEGSGDDIIVAGSGNFGLPLLFGAIKAEKKETGIQLKWTTFQEVNVSHYQIEHSKNGGTFTSIGRVYSINRFSEWQYYFCDSNTIAGNNFYRVKSVDFDGKIQYSPIVRIFNTMKNSSLYIFPNPIINYNFSLNISELNKGFYELKIFNKIGQVILKEILFIDKSELRLNKQLKPSLPKGIYFLQLKNDKFNSVNSFIIQ